MRPLGPDGVEHGEAVVSHVGERYSGMSLSVGGQPDVAVVEAHDVKSFGHEPFAPRLFEVDALAAESVHQQQHGIARVAEGLVVQLDVAVVGRCHGAPR